MKFAHRGLQRLYERRDPRRINADLVARIRRILAALDDATEPHHMDLPGLRLHRLKGDRRHLWSVRVSGNWRIVFRFDASQAVDVDLIDYH
ncbi:MAG: type II toxin-antitoxin system RelE/ParE family toxin [Acidobacteria bacterium]|nr:type II toxin-antitoxin system RelE/ParE family toxin [Acidobacteriota bacterium]